MSPFWRNCWSRAWVRWLVYVMVTLQTLVILLTQWINWKGVRAWSAAQQALVADGETLDLNSILPEPVPENQNFCAIPVLANIAATKEGEENRKRLESLALDFGDGRPALATGPTQGKSCDLGAWEGWLTKQPAWKDADATGTDAAHRLLAGFARQDDIVRPMIDALHRRESRWTPQWRDRDLPANFFAIAMPHYRPAQDLMLSLCLRSVAAAQAGDAKLAHELARVQLRLARASLDDPFLIGGLVGVTQLQYAVHATWELCRLHLGTDEEFATLAQELREFDLRLSLLQALRTELAGSVATFQTLKRSGRTGQLLAFNPDEQDGKWDRFSRALPSGWIDWNTATLVDLEHRYLIKPLREGGLVELAKETRLQEEMKHQRGLLHLDRILANLVIPASSSIAIKFAHTQVLLDQAAVACELERVHLQSRSYPAELPENIKCIDIMSGQPLRYARRSDDSYALWSIGPDGKDDGAKRTNDGSQPKRVAALDHQGDWVWDFPSK